MDSTFVLSSSPTPSPKHPVVDRTAPPENPELAIATHFAETATKYRRTHMDIAVPEGSYAAFTSAM
jgi:hypothetical protein